MIKLCMWNDGTKRWYLNRQIHRANGLAVCWSDGDCEWWWRNRRVTEYEHMMIVAQEHLNG